MQHLAKKYKFLLAFESDLCTDYVSFKWFSVMSEPTTVAVVMGGANYASLGCKKLFFSSRSTCESVWQQSDSLPGVIEQYVC
jgi:hypothetical protein